MSWVPLSVNAPPAVTSLGSLVSGAAQTLRGALEALRAALAVTQANVVDPASAQQAAINAALQAAVAAVRELIDQLLLATGCYVLVVPVPKKALVDPRTVSDEQDRNLVNPTYFPVGPFLRDLPPEQRARLYDRIDFAHLFDPTAANVGGNAYLIKTLAESLYDAGDVQRPRWRGEAYWASCQLVVGAIDYAQVANVLLYVDNLFGGATTRGQNLSRSQTTLVPSALNATVAYPETSARPAVVLAWPALPIGRVLSSFESARLVPTRVAVIRSTDFRARNALRVTDLFGSADLAVGDEGQFGARVIAEGTFDGVTNRYVDTGPFESGQEYHYHLAFKTRLEVPGAQPVLNDYAALSPSATVRYAAGEAAPLATSRPPDWQRSPNVAQLIPALGQYLTLVKTYLDSFAAGSRTVTEYQQGYLQFLDRMIARYAQQADDVIGVAERIGEIFQAPTAAGAYVRFATGRGTVGNFFADFVEAVTDPGDQGRPPFDDGTEFAAMLVFLGVGPDPAAAGASLAFLQALLAPPSVPSPVVAAVEQIAQVTAQAEQAALDALLGPQTTPSNTFGAAMDPLPPGTPDASCTS